MDDIIPSKEELIELIRQKYNSISPSLTDRVVENLDYNFFLSQRHYTRNKDHYTYTFCDWSYTKEGANFWHKIYDLEVYKTFTREEVEKVFKYYKLEFLPVEPIYEIWHQ